ncbi:MAG: hypothetical protein R3C56_30210 [Pirellulaceae bacterium]
MKAAAIALASCQVSQLLADHLATIDGVLFSDLPNDQLAATQTASLCSIPTQPDMVGSSTARQMTIVNSRVTPAVLCWRIPQAARGRIDALTASMHELGHVLGEADQPVALPIP